MKNMKFNLIHLLIVFLFIPQIGLSQQGETETEEVSFSKYKSWHQQKILDASFNLKQTEIEYGKDHSFYAIALGELALEYARAMYYFGEKYKDKAIALNKEATKRIESILGKDNSLAIEYKNEVLLIETIQCTPKVTKESGPSVNEKRPVDENREFLNEEERVLAIQNLKKELAMLESAKKQSIIVRPASAKWTNIQSNIDKNFSISIYKDELFNQGSYLKQLNLTNKEYEFDFKLISSNGKDANYDENGVLQIVANKGKVKLQVSNLSQKDLFFYILKIDEQGKLSSFVPNENCSLYGSKRLISAGVTKIFETCTFSFFNSTEKIRLKGIATEIPINFKLLLESENIIDHEDFLSNQMSNMHTSEFVFRVTSQEGAIFSKKPKDLSLIPESVTEVTRTPIPEESKDEQIEQLKEQIKRLEEQIEKPKKRTAKPVAEETDSTRILSEYTYHALLIGESDYKYNDNDLSDLDYPLKDVDSLKKVLSRFYAFKKENIKILKNPTQQDIENRLGYYIDNLTQKDHLLVFFAGHGIVHNGISYWLTNESKINKRSTWYRTNDVQDVISSIENKHTLLIIDACFGGTIFKNKRDTSTSIKVLSRLLQKDARKAMTSGLDKTVPDKSVFIEQLIIALKENEKPYITASSLYNTIKEIVIGNTDNNPQYEPINGHNGGDFIFVKK